MPETVLVSGATGYIASRLIPRLLEAGYKVRCLARQPERLERRTWYANVEVCAGDVTRPESLPAAMKGVHAAYYLIHSMSAGHGYHEVDLQSARNFAQAARDGGVGHIIYLGGLADPGSPVLALHLKSRIESGDALREAGVPVTEFRAGVIVGPGSVSFEMIRFIAEQFPIIAGPLMHRSQPIATVNVLDYLMAALTTPAARGQVIEIGSQEPYTYIDIMARYARIRGLKRISLLVPYCPVWLMTFFVDLLTPVERSYAYPLVEGLQNDSLVSDRRPLSLFPGIEIMDFNTAVRRALAETEPARMERVWLDSEEDGISIKHEGMFIDYRRATIAVNPAAFFSGLRRRVVSPSFQLGSLKAFRVEFLSEDTLRLQASAPNLPGQVWLEWKLIASRLEQTAFFAPHGLPGFMLWYLFQFHYRSLLARLLQGLVEKQP